MGKIIHKVWVQSSTDNQNWTSYSDGKTPDSSNLTPVSTYDTQEEIEAYMKTFLENVPKTEERRFFRSRKDEDNGCVAASSLSSSVLR